MKAIKRYKLPVIRYISTWDISYMCAVMGCTIVILLYDTYESC